MAVVTSFSPGENFWELNPQLLLKKEFKELYERDKKKDKSSSSNVMWWISLCYDMDRDNKWRGVPLADKQEELALELLGVGDYYEKNKKSLDPLIDAYCKLTDSPSKRRLRSMEKKMEEKTVFLDSLPYDAATYDIIDKMIAADEKLYKILATIQKDLSQDSEEGQGKGGSAPSLSDTGEI